MKKLLGSFVVAAVFLIVSPTHANVQQSSAGVSDNTPAVAPARNDDGAGIQFADEIIRRIKRLGINVIRFPNTRPVENAGELC